MWTESIIEQPPNNIQSNPSQLIRGKLLGKGGYANVYEVKDQATNSTLACKIIDKSSLLKPRARQKLMNEIKIHKSLNHPNILKFFNYFEDESQFYILLELCPYESLNVLLRRRKRLIELEVQCYLLQILSGIKYLHDHSVIHRDIKLGNILLSSQMEIKLADFGLSTKIEFEGERKRTVCGTPNYIAPEILNSQNGHSYEVDIWSFGVLMYTMLIGKPPFHSSEARLTYTKIKSAYFSFPDSISLSPQARDLISRILVLDPLERLTIDEILSHDFFTKNKIPKILPFSTLTVPLSESYQKAFDRKPATPREFIKNKEKRNSPPRSNSQVSNNRTLGNSDELCKEIDYRDISESLQTGTGSNSCLNLKKVRITSNYSAVPNGPHVWISSWVDYSNKYGLAYKLSTGCVGMFFNDSTKLIANPEATFFKYITLDKPENREIFSEFSVKDAPKAANKKVQLALYFHKYLASDQSTHSSVSEIFVKSWTASQDALLIRLSNKVVQVYFRDHTELIFCGSNRYLAFVNKNKETTISTIPDAMRSDDKEILMRMKLSKDMLLNCKG